MPKNFPSSPSNLPPNSGGGALRFDLQGNAAPSQTVADLQQGEIASITGARNGVIELQVPLNTPRRKLYGWHYVSASVTTDFFCKAEMAFFAGNSFLGTLPFSVGISNGSGSTCLPYSITSAFTTQSSNTADSLGLFVGSQNGSEPKSISLQPLYITGEFDLIRINVKEMKNVTYARLFAACVSSF
jgi:hypothetical protein